MDFDLFDWAHSEDFPLGRGDDLRTFVRLSDSELEEVQPRLRSLRMVLSRAYPRLAVYGEQSGQLAEGRLALLTVGQDGEYYYVWERKHRRRKGAPRRSFFSLGQSREFGEAEVQVWLEVLFHHQTPKHVADKLVEGHRDRDRRKRDFARDIAQALNLHLPK